MKKKLLRTLLTFAPLSVTPLIAASCDSKNNAKKLVNQTWTQGPTSKGISIGANIYASPVQMDGAYCLGIFENDYYILGKSLYANNNKVNWNQNSGRIIPTYVTILAAPVKINGVYYLGKLDKSLWNSQVAFQIFTQET